MLSAFFVGEASQPKQRFRKRNGPPSRCEGGPSSFERTSLRRDHARADDGGEWDKREDDRDDGFHGGVTLFDLLPLQCATPPDVSLT